MTSVHVDSDQSSLPRGIHPRSSRRSTSDPSAESGDATRAINIELAGGVRSVDARHQRLCPDELGSAQPVADRRAETSPARSDRACAAFAHHPALLRVDNGHAAVEDSRRALDDALGGALDLRSQRVHEHDAAVARDRLTRRAHTGRIEQSQYIPQGTTYTDQRASHRQARTHSQFAQPSRLN